MSKKHVCPICKHDNGCRSLHRPLQGEESLTPDDWRRVYWFKRYVELPFLHNLVHEAQQRRDK